jgi:hypothetical protein
MGEAKRKSDKGLWVKGPYTYETSVYRVSDVLERTALAIARNETPSQQANDVLRAILELGRRMLDPRQKTMLCMTCDYEFSRGERPIEVVIAFPFANRDDPAITSPLCPTCSAVEDEATKRAMLVNHWRKLDPHGTVQEPGHG